MLAVLCVQRSRNTARNCLYKLNINWSVRPSIHVCFLHQCFNTQCFICLCYKICIYVMFKAQLFFADMCTSINIVMMVVSVRWVFFLAVLAVTYKWVSKLNWTISYILFAPMLHFTCFLLTYTHTQHVNYRCHLSLHFNILGPQALLYEFLKVYTVEKARPQRPQWLRYIPQLVPMHVSYLLVSLSEHSCGSHIVFV